MSKISSVGLIKPPNGTIAMVAPYSTETAGEGGGSVEARQFKPKLGTILGAFALPIMALTMAALAAIATFIAPMPGMPALMRLMVVGGILLFGIFGVGWLAAAFDLCSELVEAVKRRLPVWKFQVFNDGTDEWVGSA